MRQVERRLPGLRKSGPGAAAGDPRHQTLQASLFGEWSRSEGGERPAGLCRVEMSDPTWTECPRNEFA